MENEEVRRLILEACDNLEVPEEFQEEIAEALVKDMASLIVDSESAQEVVRAYCRLHKPDEIPLGEVESESQVAPSEVPPPEVRRTEKPTGKKRFTFSFGYKPVVVGLVLGILGLWLGIYLTKCHGPVALAPAAQIDQKTLIQMKWKEFVNDAAGSDKKMLDQTISTWRIVWPPDPATGEKYLPSAYFAITGEGGPWTNSLGVDVSGYLKPLAEFLANLEKLDGQIGGTTAVKILAKNFENSWGLAADQKEKLGMQYTPSEFAEIVVKETPAAAETKEVALPTPEPVQVVPSTSLPQPISPQAGSPGGSEVAVVPTTEPTPVPSATVQAKATSFPSELVYSEWSLAGILLKLLKEGKAATIKVESVKTLSDGKKLAEVVIEETGQTVGVEITTAGVKEGTEGSPGVFGGVARINWVGVPTPVPQPTLVIPALPTSVSPASTKPVPPTRAPVPTQWKNPATPAVPAGAMKDFSLNNVKYSRNEAFEKVWGWWQDILKTGPDSTWINDQLSYIQRNGGNLNLAYNTLVQKSKVPTVAPKPTKTNYPTEVVYSESGLVRELIKHGENDWCSVLNVELMADGGRIGLVQISATGQTIPVHLTSSNAVAGSVGSTKWSNGQKVMDWR